MKKIAVFGKPGSGKSTLSKRLAAILGIKLHAMDSIEFKQNGDRVDPDIYKDIHDSILASEQWLMEGFGPYELFNQRLEAADTLIYIDLPYVVSYWLVTKRFLKSILIKPEGWPDGSSVLKGTMESYKVLKLCPKFWNNEFIQKLEKNSKQKRLFIIRSLFELNYFIGKNVS